MKFILNHHWRECDRQLCYFSSF